MATGASRRDLRSRPKPGLAVVAGSGAALPVDCLRRSRQNPHHQSLTFTQNTRAENFTGQDATLSQSFLVFYSQFLVSIVFHALPTSEKAGGMESLFS